MKLRSTALFVAGLLMIASAGAHALLGWPGLASGLIDLNAPADLMTGLALSWYWGSAALAAFGVIVLVAARRIWAGDATPANFLWPIAVVHLFFGLAALLATNFNPFFLLFIVLAALTAAPLLGMRDGRSGTA